MGRLIRGNSHIITDLLKQMIDSSGREGDLTGRKHELYCIWHIWPPKLMVKMVWCSWLHFLYNENHLYWCYVYLPEYRKCYTENVRLSSKHRKVCLRFCSFLSKLKDIDLQLHACTNCCTCFDVLLTVHHSIFISVFNQLDAQNLFHNKFIYASTCFEHMCSSSGGQNCITQPLVSSHW